MKFLGHFLSKIFTFAVLFALISCITAQQGEANTYVIYVGPKGSEAYTNAQAKEDNEFHFAQRTFHRALTQASKLLESGEHTVIVVVAAGAYYGKAKQGTWKIPQIANSQGTLIIMGGYNDDFSGRQPFGLLTALSQGRVEMEHISSLRKRRV